MIGKTLYKAKVKDGKVVMEAKTVVEITKKFYKFDGEYDGVPKRDVGVICFLTEKEAIEFLVEKLKYSIAAGEEYIVKEKKHLREARELLGPVKVDEPILYHNYYKCEDCNTEWDNSWSCTCDDECPVCAVPYSPYKSEDINAE